MAQVYGVALDDLRPRVAVAQALGEEWIDLDGQVAAAPAEPALDLGGERSGAGTQFHHDGLAAFGHRGADRLGQVPRAGGDGPHAGRCTHPLTQEQGVVVRLLRGLAETAVGCSLRGAGGHVDALVGEWGWGGVVDRVGVNGQGKDAYHREVTGPLAAEHPSAEAIHLIFEAIAERARGRGFRGSPFLNAAAEYPDADHPVRRLVASSACEGRRAAVSAAAARVAPVWIRRSLATRPRPRQREPSR
ncbi:hypothetical protein [Streptomyces sp. NPDC127197]|uniref:hypothetical protein n=1 Tax=Streptomyces sp. NPDC127197 TaxID=3345388 RepID=UPI003645332E